MPPNPTLHTSLIPSSHRVLNLLAWFLFMCGIMLIGIEIERFYIHKSNQELEQRYDATHELSSNILLTHERLTASARVYILTGKTEWLNQYHALTSLQKQQLNQLIQLTPNLLASVVSDINSYSDRLLDVESSAFMLFKANYTNEALDLLSNHQYIEYKDKLARLFDNAKSHITQLRSAKHNDEVSRGIMDATALIGLLAIVFVIQLMGIRWLSQWRSQLSSKDIELETLVEVLRNRESSFRDLVNAVPEGLVSVDSYGGVIHANRTASQWLGSQLTATGNHILDSLPLPQVLRDEIYDAEQGIRPESHGKRFNLEIQGPDGTQRTLELTLHPSGDDYSHLMIFADLTLRLEAENAVQARIKAERENQTKSDFLANMSHELRTPLHGIIGFAEILDDTPLTPPQQESVTTILRSAKGLLALLNDILDFSKIQAGQFQLETIDMDLEETVRETMLMLRSGASAKSVHINYAFNAPRFVRGDPLRIRQVLLNLISNAIKFTPAGGQISIAATLQPGHPTQVMFKVTDSGMGIAKDKQIDIFNKFTQADNSTSRKFGGTGLGLAISKQLVGLMHGSIGLDSAPGQGSTFWFNLPLEVIDPKSKKPAVAEVTDIPKVGTNQDCTILIVDDNKVNLMLAKRILQSHNYHNLKEASNGVEALNILRNQQPYQRINLVLMDCQMPEMDGYEATRNWRAFEAENKLPRMPIVALTANAMAGTRDTCLKSGMDDILTKPFDKQALLNLVSRHVSRCIPCNRPAPFTSTQQGSEP